MKKPEFPKARIIREGLLPEQDTIETKYKNLMTDYKQLAQELYTLIEEVSDFIDYDKVPLPLMEKSDNLTKKYEELTTRSTGRTTVLYMKAITEALENPGKSVEFIDHYPHNWDRATIHRDSLRSIIHRLHYDIIVHTKGQAQVYLYNKFGL